LLELSNPLVDKVEAHMGRPIIAMKREQRAGIRGQGNISIFRSLYPDTFFFLFGDTLPGQLDRFTGHLPFGKMTLLGDILHPVTISITGAKIHLVVDFGRVLLQGLFNGTHGIDEFPPVHGAQKAQAADAVTDGKLVRRLLLIFRLYQLIDG